MKNFSILLKCLLISTAILFSWQCSSQKIELENAQSQNIDFLIESIDLIEKNDEKEYQNYEKLNLVPSFFNLIKKIIFYFFRNKH